MSIRFAALLVAVVALAGCTSGGSSHSSAPPSSPSGGPSIVGAPTPVGSAPTTVASASCPWATQSFVQKTIGMRQGRQTVLRSGGAVVGCRFYAQAHPDAECGQTCFDGEHLPDAAHPALEIVTRRYASADDAHNAFVLASRQGTDAATVTIRSGVPGVAYRTTFYPKDGARDWACAWSVGSTATFVRVAEDNSMLVATLVAQQVARAS